MPIIIKKKCLLQANFFAEAKVLDLKLKALILDVIHNIDVTDQLISNGVKVISEWEWQKQLRFYFSSHAFMRMVDTEFMYTFEYQVSFYLTSRESFKNMDS